MRFNLFKNLLVFITIVSLIVFYLSIVGLKTDRFNNQIVNKIIQIDKNFDLKLNKVNFIFDPLNLKIKAKTIDPIVFYSKNPLPLESIDTEISLKSLFDKEIIFSQLRIISKSILISDLLYFVSAQNKNIELFILQKIIKNGFIILDLDINFDEKGKIKNDYLITGIVKEGEIEFLKSNLFKNINFNFEIKNNNYLFKNIGFYKNNISFISEKLNIEKKDNIHLIEGTIKNKKSKLNKEILDLVNFNSTNINFDNTSFISKSNFSLELDRKFRIKNTSVKSNIELDNLIYNIPDKVGNYFVNLNKKIIIKKHKLNLDYNNKKIFLIGNGKININNKFENIEYSFNKIDDNISFSSDVEIDNITLKTQKFLYTFFPKIEETINFKKNKLNLKYINNKILLSGSGKIKIEKEYEKINYFFSKNKNNLIYDVNLNLKHPHFKIDQLNYKKKKDSNLKLKVKGNYFSKDIILSYFSLLENKNKIEINDLVLNEKNQFVQLDSAYLNYVDTGNKKNKFLIQKIKKNIYKFGGSSLNANSLINELIINENKKNNKIFKNDINLIIDMDRVFIDEIYFVENLNGKIFIKSNKTNKADLSAYFKNNKKINFSITTDEEGQTVTTLTSTWAKPLVNRYKFIKGFEEGYLDFNSVKKDGISNSVLIIDNFKVKEISVLAKLLALASLQGIADLLTGEGIRFTDFEMKFSNNKRLMRIEELYAIGPSISILMEGYIQSKELISLRGTLVPASTINRTIASIPLLGDILVGKKVGEGVFGVSFKIKGPPKDLETTVNPIKTLTPRFITRTLEKIKKN